MNAIALAILLLSVSVSPVGAAAPADSDRVSDRASAPPIAENADSLAASYAAPWNPPRPLLARRPWERAMLLPGRIISLPLSGLGYLTRRSMLVIEDSGRVPMGPQPPRAKHSPSVAVGLSHFGDRTGVGLSLELRTPEPRREFVPRFGVQYSATTHFYNRTQATLTSGPASLQYAYEWRPQEQFHGIGLESAEDSLSDYAIEFETARAGLTRAWGRDPDRNQPRLTLNAWGGPRSALTSTGRDARQVPFDRRFPGLAGLTLGRRVEHLTYGAAIKLDERRGAPHWSRGGALTLAAENFTDPVRALALHDAAATGAGFRRFTGQLDVGTSFMRDPRSLRLMAKVVDQQVDARADRFLVADLATLGGRDGLLGYSPGRFRDKDLLLTRLTYVFPLARRFEVDLHSEFGGVYGDVWHDVRIGGLKHSFGMSLRGRGDRTARGAVGFDISPESIRINYTLGVPE